VFVLEDYRGQGLAKWLLATILAHPALQGLRRWMLVTRDAHGLYQQQGFQPARRPENVMEITHPGICNRSAIQPNRQLSRNIANRQISPGQAYYGA